MDKFDIYLKLSDLDQVRWWNSVGSKMVKVTRYEKIVIPDTGKTLGYYICVRDSFLKNIICSKANSFWKKKLY